MSKSPSATPITRFYLLSLHTALPYITVISVLLYLHAMVHLPPIFQQFRAPFLYRDRIWIADELRLVNYSGGDVPVTFLPGGRYGTSSIGQDILRDLHNRWATFVPYTLVKHWNCDSYSPCAVPTEREPDQLIISNFSELGESAWACYEQIHPIATGRHPHNIDLRTLGAVYSEHNFIIGDQTVVVTIPSVPTTLLSTSDLTWFSRNPVQINAIPAAGGDVFPGVLDDLLDDVFAQQDDG